MRCLCNKKVPMVARGNNFTLIVELQQIVISDEGKEITTQIEGTVTNVKICPSNGEPVGWNDWQMAQTSNGAAVAIDIPSIQPLGAYGIEITGTRTNGSGAFRWYAKPGEGFIIVDASSDNYLTDMVRIYTITGVVGVGSSGGGGGGGSATVGTLNTNNSTALAPKDMESFDGAINLNRVAKTGNYNDLNNKPTIPAEQIQSDWNQTNTNAKDFIKNKPTIPSLSGYATQQWVRDQRYLTEHQSLSGYATEQWVREQHYLTEHQSLSGYATEQWVREQHYLTEHQSLSGYATQQWVNEQNFLKQHQDISGKENRMQIVVPNSLSFLADTGKYYRITQSGTITVTLPSVVSDYIEGFLLFFTAAADDCLHFDTQDTVLKADGYEIKAGDICEINAVYNGDGWQVTVIKFNS